MKDKLLRNGSAGIAFCLFLIFGSAIGDDGQTAAGVLACTIGMVASAVWIFLFILANPDWGNF